MKATSSAVTATGIGSDGVAKRHKFLRFNQQSGRDGSFGSRPSILRDRAENYAHASPDAEPQSYVLKYCPEQSADSSAQAYCCPHVPIV